MAQIRAVVFNIDGTLVDSKTFGARVFQEALRKGANRYASLAEIRQYEGCSELGILSRLVGQGDLESTLRIYFSLLQTTFEKEGQPFEGICSLVRTLHGLGVPLGVVSGRSIRGATIVLRSLHMQSFFSLVEGGNQQIENKANSLTRILQYLDLPAGQAVYVGDTLLDVQEALRIGMWAAGAGWGSTHTLPRSLATERYQPFTSVQQFSDWLLPQLSISSRSLSTSPISGNLPAEALS